MEALEELNPEQHGGRISYVIGGIYTLPVRNRGPSEKVPASVGEQGQEGEQQQASSRALL